MAIVKFFVEVLMDLTLAEVLSLTDFFGRGAPEEKKSILSMWRKSFSKFW